MKIRIVNKKTNIIFVYFWFWLNNYLDKIVVGSHSGIIRIYNPSSSEPDSITNNHATDLLLEKNLGMPIVQIDIGKFIR
jgi:hypothetical protein